MATKKESTYQSCAGVTCNDGSCVTCQIGTAERHHDELLAALKDVGAHIGEVATTLDGIRKAFPAQMAVAPKGLKAEPPAASPAKVEPPPAAAKVEAPSAAPPAAPKALTIELLRPHVLEWIKVNSREKFVEVLAKFGATKLPDVKDAELPKLAEALGLKIG